jgi:hypothetical protein
MCKAHTFADGLIVDGRLASPSNPLVSSLRIRASTCHMLQMLQVSWFAAMARQPTATPTGMELLMVITDSNHSEALFVAEHKLINSMEFQGREGECP